MKPYFLPLAAACLSSGCASVMVERAKPESEGVRFYRPDMYVLVSYEVTDQCVVNVKKTFLPLPNKNEEYVIRARAGIGSVTFKPTLEQGWNLTGFEATADSKVSETITALAALITAVRPQSEATLTDKKREDDCATKVKDVKPRPGLYRLEYTNGQVSGFTHVPLLGEEIQKAVRPGRGRPATR